MILIFFTQKNIILFGVSKDNKKSHKKFIEDFQLPFNLLCDEEKTMLKDYNAWVQKSMFGKKYMGIQRSTVFIDNKGKVIHHWEKIKSADKHPQEVKKFINSYFNE